jgi:molecular chaperone GrpE (heat shock protein)
MLDGDFVISETPWPVPAEVAAADPAQRMADDITRLARLRELLRDQRTRDKKEMRALLLKLLEVADALDRLLAAPPDPTNADASRLWESLRVTRKLLDQGLHLQNVTPMNLLGCEADPALCEVDSYRVRPDLPDEAVVQEVIRGYLWGDEQAPLRTAVVIISRRV